MAQGGAHLPPQKPKDSRRAAPRTPEAPAGRRLRAAEEATPTRHSAPPKAERLQKPAPAKAARTERESKPPRSEAPRPARTAAHAPERPAPRRREAPAGDRPRKRRKLDRFPLWPVIVVLGVVMIFAAWKLIDLLVGYRLDRAAYDALRDIAVVQLTPAPSPSPAPEGEPTPEPVPVSEVPLQIDWELLRQTNADIIGWLYCPDSPINYPVVQATDNDKYLALNFEGSSSAAGAIFADFNSVLHLRQSHLILYGHNMKDNSMFGSLKNYGDPAYYEEHPVFYFLSPTQNYRVELFAAQTVEALKTNYPTYFSDDGVFGSYIAQMTSSAYWVNPAAANTDYQIITMSTCTSSDTDRLVLQGRLVPIQ